MKAPAGYPGSTGREGKAGVWDCFCGGPELCGAGGLPAFILLPSPRREGHGVRAGPGLSAQMELPCHPSPPAPPCPFKGPEFPGQVPVRPPVWQTLSEGGGALTGPPLASARAARSRSEPLQAPSGSVHVCTSGFHVSRRESPGGRQSNTSSSSWIKDKIVEEE